jgi:hypothetical protein
MTPDEKIEFLLRKFLIERILCLLLVGVSIALIVVIAINMDKADDTNGLLMLLGPSGVVSLCFAQLLKMWEDCVELMKTSK